MKMLNTNFFPHFLIISYSHVLHVFKIAKLKFQFTDSKLMAFRKGKEQTFTITDVALNMFYLKWCFGRKSFTDTPMNCFLFTLSIWNPFLSGRSNCHRQYKVIWILLSILNKCDMQRKRRFMLCVDNYMYCFQHSDKCQVFAMEADCHVIKG